MLPLGSARVAFAEESIEDALEFIRANNYTRGAPQLEGFENALDGYRRSLMNLESAQRDFRRQHQYLLLSEPKIARVESWLASTSNQLESAPVKLEHISGLVSNLRSEVNLLSESTNKARERFQKTQSAVNEGKNQLRALYYRILILETEYLGSGETKTLLLDEFSLRNMVADLQRSIHGSAPEYASSPGPDRYIRDDSREYMQPRMVGSAPGRAAYNVPSEITAIIRTLNAVSTQLRQLTEFVNTQVQHGESVVQQIDNHSVSVANLQRRTIEMMGTIQQITGEAEFMKEEIDIQQAQFNLVRSRIESELDKTDQKLAALKQSIDEADQKVAAFAAMVQ
jgi:chromosome segregation ATPase